MTQCRLSEKDALNCRVSVVDHPDAPHVYYFLLTNLRRSNIQPGAHLAWQNILPKTDFPKCKDFIR